MKNIFKAVVTAAVLILLFLISVGATAQTFNIETSNMIINRGDSKLYFENYQAKISIMKKWQENTMTQVYCQAGIGYSHIQAPNLSGGGIIFAEAGIGHMDQLTVGLRGVYVWKQKAAMMSARAAHDLTYGRKITPAVFLEAGNTMFTGYFIGVGIEARHNLRHISKKVNCD